MSENTETPISGLRMIGRQQWDQLQRLVGGQAEQIAQLSRHLNQIGVGLEQDAGTWRQLLRTREELAEWLLDQALHEDGRIVQARVDAGLGGEDFVPSSFTALHEGQRYRFRLASTFYDIHFDRAD